MLSRKLWVIVCLSLGIGAGTSLADKGDEVGDRGGSGSDSTLGFDSDGDGYTTDGVGGAHPGFPDCNDTDASINPGALEICNGVDDNCNGSTDEGIPQTHTYYRDADGDGHGDPLNSAMDCRAVAPPGYVGSNDDCNDSSSAVHPGASETIGDNVDEDCDGHERCYADNDLDGFGGSGTITSSDVDCFDSGEATSVTDCDDSDSSFHPGALDVNCDARDQNCNGVNDDGYAPHATSCGVGACGSTGTTSCVAGVELDSCHPGSASAEVCDGIDNDCDSVVDNGVLSTFYRDVDSDGFGTPATSTEACSAPSGFVSNSADCNDGDAAIHPGVSDPCDGVDNDCDLAVDEDFSSAATSCGVGACHSSGSTSCVSGAVIDSCTAGTPAPSDATCDGIDDDCNGVADEDFVSAPTSCGIGACHAGGATSCVAGSVLDSCSPGAPSPEVCGASGTGNGIDDDCDGVVDNGGARFVAVSGSDSGNDCLHSGTPCASLSHAVQVACNGETVLIGAGSFSDNVIVSKPLEIQGAGQASTTIYPAVSNPNPECGSSLCGSNTGASHVMVVTHSNVAIHDLTIDGDNPALTSGQVVGSADIDARNGIIEGDGGTFDNLLVHHVTVRNVFLRGIYARSGGNGFSLHHNQIQNVRSSDSAGAIALFAYNGSGSFSSNTIDNCFDGVVSNWSRGVSMSNNVVHCDPAMRGSGTSGVHTDNSNGGPWTLPNNGPDSLTGNLVEDCDYGLFVFVPIAAPSVTGNTVRRAGTDGVALFGGAWDPNPRTNTPFSSNVVDGEGSCSNAFHISDTTFYYHVADTEATLTDNQFSGCSTGVLVDEDDDLDGTTDLTKSVYLSGSGNTISSNGTGVHLAPNVDSGSVLLDGNKIYGNTVSGFDNDSSILASAQCSWWGDLTGPFSPDNLPGAGNSAPALSSVDFSPWAANSGLSNVSLWPDSDGDGYGSAAVSSLVQCGPPSAGYVLNNGDCDDLNAAIHPGATDYCGDGIDSNCDSLVGTSLVHCSSVSCASADACDSGDLCRYSATCSGWSGHVRYYSSGVAVSGVTVAGSSSIDPPTSSSTDGSGTYSMSLGGDVTLTPQSLAATVDECNSAITGADASQIAKQVVGLVAFTARQRLAGDVSNNTPHKLSSFDASLVAQKAVDCEHFALPVATAYGSDWAFVDHDSTADVDNLPRTRSYTPFTALQNYDFDALLYGDVTHNWSSHGSGESGSFPSGGTVDGAAPWAPAETGSARTGGASIYVAGGPKRLPDGTWQIAFGIQNADGILGLDVALSSDADAATILRAELGGIAGGFQLEQNALDERYALAIFGTQPMVGTGRFLTVTYRLNHLLTGDPIQIQAEANEGQIPISIGARTADPARSNHSSSTIH